MVLDPEKSGIFAPKFYDKIMGQIRYTSFSECGARRDNEDYCQVVADPDKERYLFVVCDGMGGHAMGEVASQVICTTICDYWNSAPVDSDTQTVLKEAFHKASEALDAKSDVLNHVEMGTTMVLAAIVGNQLTIAHCGDSRCYFLRPNFGLVYQTKDHVCHSVFGDFIDKSFFSYHASKAEIEIHRFELQQSDRIFLCTDGVSSYCDPDILKERLMDDKSPEDVADVVQFLCEKFSKDNYTGILIYYE
jgi:protein phosphatase